MATRGSQVSECLSGGEGPERGGRVLHKGAEANAGGASHRARRSARARAAQSMSAESATRPHAASTPAMPSRLVSASAPLLPPVVLAVDEPALALAEPLLEPEPEGAVPVLLAAEPVALPVVVTLAGAAATERGSDSCQLPARGDGDRDGDLQPLGLTVKSLLEANTWVSFVVLTNWTW